MGAATLAKVNRPGAAIVRSQYDGNLRLYPFPTLTMSNSYATGGDTITDATLPKGYGTIVDADLFPTVQGYTFKFDAANKKVLAYVSGGTEVTSTTDLSALGALNLFMLVHS